MSRKLWLAQWIQTAATKKSIFLKTFTLSIAIQMALTMTVIVAAPAVSVAPKYASRIIETKSGQIRGILQVIEKFPYHSCRT